uniref:serine-rich adhesin for platelets n=1 Tax=Anopheles coluzzii TaxID=1518534 RepID=UPI0020FF8B81|nr:serine-rich adhesin for platelets [Anopheles coluzzii]
MINLSTSTAAHAYACRTTGSGMVVGRDVSNSRSSRSLRHTVGTTDGVGTDSVIGTGGGLDMLGPGYANINGFRNNRFQYEIPTVGQHYGNAFHLGEDDEEVSDLFIEHHHLTETDVQTIMEEHIAEDDDDDEDVEMSTAVEVISIDPNCDYDTDEEDDENDEEDQYENRIHVQNVQDNEIEEEEEEEENEDEEETQEVGTNVFTQSRSSALSDAQIEAECDGHVNALHCQIMEETVVTGDRSRSRSCSNTDASSSSTSSSSRDSSTSSTYSNANIADSNNPTICSNQSTVKPDKPETISQNHQDSYHSYKDIYEDEDDDDDDEEDDEEDDDPDLDFSPTKNTLWELPAKLLQDKSGSKKSKTKPPGRRKRCSSSQRQSFSMPQSPVGAGTLNNGGAVAGLLPTSLSFDDLDSLVCDLSPTKILPVGRVSNNELEGGDEEDLLDDQLVDPENFDLTAYITGDDSTSCDTNSERFTACESKATTKGGVVGTQRTVAQLKSPPKRSLQKSRGKELKVLRQLMLPEERPPVQATNANVKKDEAVSNGKRDSATKAVRKLTMDEEESSEAEEEDIAQRNSQRLDKREELSGIRRGRKRKAADDTDKDPTWNPNGGSSKSKTEVKQSIHKQAITNNVVVGEDAVAASNVPIGSSKVAGTSANQCTSSSEEGDTSVSKPSSMVTKGVKFGQVIKTESSAARLLPVSLSKKSLTNTPQKDSAVKTMARDQQAQTNNVHRKKTNVKLDHDYCSPKRHGTSGSNIPGTLGAIGGQPRKTIEIPFLMPMKEQLKQERKLQKEKKRVEQSVPAKKHPSQLGAVSTSSDNNGKDKQTQPHHRSCNGKDSVSPTNSVQKIALPNAIPPVSDGGEHLLSAVNAKRTDVDKTCVNRIVTGSSDSSGANETSHPDESAGEVKKFAIPNTTGGGGGGVGGVKRQISLLKVNQPTAALAKPADDGAASHVSASSQVKIGDTTISGSISAALDGATNRAVEGGSVKKETLAIPEPTTPEVEVSNKTSEVVVRKKLNLQEYKKRREHPASMVLEGAPKVNDSFQRPPVRSDRHNDSAVNSTSGYSNGTLPVSNAVSVLAKPEPTVAKPDQPLPTKPSKPAVAASEPLDPISAAKMKALRMQQLKKEAAIKSNEAKLSQKTIPLMPIVPLAQITSLEFDEHGNPLPLNEAKAGKPGAGTAAHHDALKLHPDYEEIIIVSIGCNTALTISPAEKGVDALVHAPQCNFEDGGQQQQQHQQAHNNPHALCSSNKEASRLLNISDTIKRCCPSVDTMPGNSLIASIQEVVIKKSNICSSNHANGAGGGVNATTSSQTVLVGDEASVAERAVTLKAEAMSVGAACNGPDGGRTHEQQQQQYLLHQSSPYVGVSPPSSFSPGKPERAHISNTRNGEYLVYSPSKQSRSSKTNVDETKTMRSSPVTMAAQATATDNAAAVVVEHGEDKVIMHLRKDRVRTQRVDAATQTEPSGRFPPLCKLAPLKVVSAGGGGDNKKVSVATHREQKRTERRSYRRHRRRNRSESPSDADSDATDRPPCSRSKSHQDRHRAWDRHSRSRSRSRSRHRSSRRRSSCSSGSRSRSRSGYSARVHPNHHSQHQPTSIAGSGGSGCNNGSRYSRSRRKSRTCSRSSSSTSSSRYGSRGRRSLSSSSSCSSMSSSDASDGDFSRRGGDGGHGGGASRSSRSRSRSPRSRSRSGMRSSTPDRQRYHPRDHANQRRAISPERNIVYVGRLESTTRKEDLQQKFQPYGKIVKITLHMKANGSRYGFVTFEKPQHAYDAIDARGTDPNLRNYDVSFGGRRAFCRTQYADLDGELSNDHDHQMPYVTLDGALLLPARGPLPYSVPAMCHKEPTYGGGGGGGGGGGVGAIGSGGGAGESFDDLLKKFKKEICARKT